MIKKHLTYDQEVLDTSKNVIFRKIHRKKREKDMGKTNLGQDDFLYILLKMTFLGVSRIS